MARRPQKTATPPTQPASERGKTASLPLSTARPRPLNEDQRLAWLRLIRSENVGPVTFRELINRFGSATAALDALPELSRQGGLRRNIRVCSERDALAELKHARQLGMSPVAFGEAGYPPLLGEVDAPPPLLYTLGHHELADQEIVSIVGARNGSAAGQKFARTTAAELGANNIVTASGLALGIDAAAHAAALATGTIAVVAGGIDVIYPPQNEALHNAIGKDGLIISELPPGFQPRSQDFPRRNRIISGIAKGTLVVEAAARSGSLITARYAAEQGRDVFAVPGNPLDPRAVGTNRLLRDGAILTTCTDDIIEHLRSGFARNNSDQSAIRDASHAIYGASNWEELSRNAAVEQSPAASERDAVVACLGTTPTELDEIIRATALPIQKVKCALLELDMAGRLEYHPGRLISLMPDEGSLPSSHG